MSFSALMVTDFSLKLRAKGLLVNGFTLPASYAIDNACYIVMAPQTTALNIVYELYNPATNTTGTFTTTVPLAS